MAAILHDALTMLWQATPTMSDEASFTAWATAVITITTAISGAIGALLTLLFTKGKEAWVDVHKTQQVLNAQEIELAKLNADEITRGYEQALTDAKNDLQGQINTLKTQHDECEKKHDDCEKKYISLVEIAARLTGKLEVIENRQGETREQVKKLASDSGLNIFSPEEPKEKTP